MTMTAEVPVGTEKNVIVVINGLPYVTCDRDPGECIDNQFRPLTYYDAVGDVTTNYADAVSVDLPICEVCCDGERYVLLADAVEAAVGVGAPVYGEEYANDGTAIADLAATGTYLVAFRAHTHAASVSRWDATALTPPAGYTYAWLRMVSHEAAVAYSAL